MVAYCTIAKESCFHFSSGESVIFVSLAYLKHIRTGDVDVELVLDILAAVVDDDLVGSLVLLLEALDAQDGRVRLAVGPCLEAAALALAGEIFEALNRHINMRSRTSYMYGLVPDLVPLDPRHGVAKDLEVDEQVVLLVSGELVLRLRHELGVRDLALGARLQRRGGPAKVLKSQRAFH